MQALDSDHTNIHPDNLVPSNANCYGYVFARLGIVNDLVVNAGVFHPQEELEARHFEKVDSFADADVIGIKDESGTYAHMALIDSERNNRIFHRVNGGQPATETSLRLLENEYPPRSGWQFVFLRKK